MPKSSFWLGKCMLGISRQTDLSLEYCNYLNQNYCFVKSNRTRLPPPDSPGKGLIGASPGAGRVGARGTREAKQLCKMNRLSEAEVPAWCLEPPGRSGCHQCHSERADVALQYFWDSWGRGSEARGCLTEGAWSRVPSPPSCAWEHHKAEVRFIQHNRWRVKVFVSNVRTVLQKRRLLRFYSILLWTFFIVLQYVSSDNIFILIIFKRER